MIPKISAHIEMVLCCSISGIYLLTKTSPYSLMIYGAVLCKIMTVGKLAVIFCFFYNSSIIPPPPTPKPWHNSGQDFGTQIMKTKIWQTFSEDISKLIISGDILDLKITAKDTLSNKMIINLNMLCSSMENKLRINGQRRDVITPELRGSGKKDAQIL